MNAVTYDQAKKLASKKNPDITYTGDAGNGCSFEVYWCSWRKRQVWTCINASGARF